MNDWVRDKKWADRFLPEIKAILGQLFIGAAPAKEDQQHNTDLIVLKMEPIRIACRIRSYGYWEQFRDEFTIRQGRPRGTKTELAKIIEGWGDYFFYGFSNRYEDRLHAYGIGDLKVFRLWLMQQLRQTGRLPGQVQANTDGSSNFRAFKWRELPSRFLVTSWNILNPVGAF